MNGHGVRVERTQVSVEDESEIGTFFSCSKNIITRTCAVLNKRLFSATIVHPSVLFSFNSYSAVKRGLDFCYKPWKT